MPANPNSTTDLPQCLSIMSSWRYDVDFLPQSMLLPRGFRLCESSLRWWNPKHVISLLTVYISHFYTYRSLRDQVHKTVHGTAYQFSKKRGQNFEKGGGLYIALKLKCPKKQQVIFNTNVRHPICRLRHFWFHAAWFRLFKIKSWNIDTAVKPNSPITNSFTSFNYFPIFPFMTCIQTEFITET